MNAFRFILENSGRCSISLLCRKLGVSRCGYYAWLNRPVSERQKENKELLGEIKSIFDASRNTYGSPRIHATLKRRGYEYNKKRIARLMRENAIVAKMAEKFKPRNRTYEHYRGTPNLLRKQAFPTARNQVWVGDMTYLRVNGCWTYLAVVMDLHTRKILGWSYARRRSVTLAEEALLMAIKTSKRIEKTIFHSDQGIEYASNGYRKTMMGHGIVPSMSRKGCCWDNAFMESFFHTLKTEMVYFHKFSSLEQAAAYIMDYITFYNEKRIHSGLNYTTPNDYYRIAA